MTSMLSGLVIFSQRCGRRYWLRLCHNSPPCPNPNIEKMTLVKTITKKMKNNNNLHLESPINVKIIPVVLDDIENHDTITMQIYSKGKGTTDFEVKQSSKQLELVNTKCTELSDICLIKVPFNLNVSITALEDANVEVEKLLFENFIIQAGTGLVSLKNIQAKDIKVHTVGGSVDCQGKLQAEKIEIKSSASSGIKCSNVVGKLLTVSTHSGPICVKSCYCDNSHFTTALGNIQLDHLHKSANVDIIQHGNLHVSGLNGNINASIKSGDVFMHISKLVENSSIFIHEKGKIDLRLTNIADNMLTINLIAGKINIEDSFITEGTYKTETHPHRFSYPLLKGSGNNELLAECRNGVIILKKTESPFYLPECK